MVEDILPNMRVYCTKRVIKQVDISILVDRTGKTYTLLLTTTQVDTL